MGQTRFWSRREGEDAYWILSAGTMRGTASIAFFHRHFGAAENLSGNSSIGDRDRIRGAVLLSARRLTQEDKVIRQWSDCTKVGGHLLEVEFDRVAGCRAVDCAVEERANGHRYPLIAWHPDIQFAIGPSAAGSTRITAWEERLGDGCAGFVLIGQREVREISRMRRGSNRKRTCCHSKVLLRCLHAVGGEVDWTRVTRDNVLRWGFTIYFDSNGTAGVNGERG